MPTDYLQNKYIFETEALQVIKRIGINNFLDWLANHTDFFIAPASTNYHGNYTGGLCEHSLTVYEEFWKIAPIYGYDKRNSIALESSAIVCLFHDICKINTYKPENRWRKNDDGKWDSYSGYIFDDKNKFGSHSGKSLFYIQQFLKLTQEEYIAIFHHMGAWDKSTYNNPGDAYSMYKLAWLLHVADESATYIRGI